MTKSTGTQNASVKAPPVNKVPAQCKPGKITLRDSGKAKGNEKVRIPFSDRLLELEAFKKKHGHLNVRKRDNRSLYNFCRNVRASHNGRRDVKLGVERKAALDALGFEWTTSKRGSSSGHKADLKASHGHVDEEGSSIYDFCLKYGGMAKPGRTARLDESECEYRFEEIFYDRFNHMVEFRKRHGHLNVTRKEDFGLSYFCDGIRQARKGKCLIKLTHVHIATLDALGFEWVVPEGEHSISGSGADGDSRRRVSPEEYINSLIRSIATSNEAEQPPERIEQSDDETMSHEGKPRERITFEHRIAALTAFKKKHGHLFVPHKVDKSLCNFICNVRQARKGTGKSKLTDDRIAALDALGFPWEVDKTERRQLGKSVVSGFTVDKPEP